MGDVLDDAKVVHRRGEGLTGPVGRRKWSDADKARIVAETARPGAVVSEIARRWQVSPQRVFDWRRRAREGSAATMAPAEPGFVPIMAQTPPLSLPEPVLAPAGAMHPIEIKLLGAELRVAPGTDAALLSLVLHAIRASAA